MRRLLILVGVFATVAFVSSATASTTYHGTFTGGTGTYENGVSVALTGSGNWNLNIGSNGVQLTGMVFVTHAPCNQAESFPPCQFNLPLTAVAWGSGSWTGNVFVMPGTLQLGQVHFDVTFAMAGDSVTLTFEISGCPYYWKTWIFTGIADM